MSTSASSRLPPEVLLLILERVAQYDDEPSIPVGFNSPWCQSIRSLKAFVGVCKAWWETGITILYRDVYLHRVGQLFALVDSLETSLRRSGDEGYGKWVSFVEYEYWVPETWKDAHDGELNRLFKLCPKLRQVIHKPQFPDSGSEDPQRLQPLLSVSNSCFHLMIENEECCSIDTFSSIIGRFHSLQTLELALSYHVPVNSFDPIELPTLRELTLGLPWFSVHTRPLMEAIASRWTMPCLQILWIDLLCEHVFTGRGESGILEILLLRHGLNLTFLSLDTHILDEPEIPVLSVLSLCPKLQELRLFSWGTFFSDVAMPPHSLERIKYMASSTFQGYQDTENLAQHLTQWANRDLFPALQVIKISDHRVEYGFDSKWPLYQINLLAASIRRLQDAQVRVEDINGNIVDMDKVTLALVEEADTSDEDALDDDYQDETSSTGSSEYWDDDSDEDEAEENSLDRDTALRIFHESARGNSHAVQPFIDRQTSGSFLRDLFNAIE